MNYREVGNTGIEISEIGFGCGDNAGLMIKGSAEQQAAIIGRAIDLGINYFDTAPQYGDGLSEQNFGRAIKTLGVRPYITSKTDVYEKDLDDLAGYVVSSLDESLQRMGVDYVDFLQIHNSPRMARSEGAKGMVPLSIEDYLGPNGVLEGLERAQRAGKARFFGFTQGTYEPDRILLDTGRFSLINLQCNLINPAFAVPAPDGLQLAEGTATPPGQDPLITYAHDRGCGVVIINGLFGGALTESGIKGDPGHPWAKPAHHRAQAQALKFLSQPGVHNMSQAAIRWLLMFHGINSVLGGFSEIEQVEESAGNSGQPGLTEQELKRIEMVWRNNFGLPRE